MQEPVYVLHLVTCHGRIMARLKELLLTKTQLFEFCHFFAVY